MQEELGTKYVGVPQDVGSIDEALELSSEGTAERCAKAKSRKVSVRQRAIRGEYLRTNLKVPNLDSGARVFGRPHASSVGSERLSGGGLTGIESVASSVEVDILVAVVPQQLSSILNGARRVFGFTIRRSVKGHLSRTDKSRQYVRE